MTYSMRFLPLSCLAALAASSLLPPAQQGSPRVLVFSKTMGYRHASIEAGVESIQQLGRKHGFEVTSTEDASVFNATALSKYSAVIFLCTTGDVLDEAQQDALVTFVRSGGGFLGVHSATDTEYDWPWYGSLVGAYFVRHPSDPNVRVGYVTSSDYGRDAMPRLPDPWVRADEWYEFRNFNQNVDVLLNVDEKSYKKPSESPRQEPRPIAWLHEFDGGRAFYTAMGHTVESYSEQPFLDHLVFGIRFAVGSVR